MTDLERAREDMRYKKHIGGFAYKQAKATYERLLRKERRQCKELGRKRLALVEFRGRLSIVDIREKPIKGYCHMLSKDGKKLYLESYDEPTGCLMERILVGHVIGIYANRQQVTYAYAERKHS